MSNGAGDIFSDDPRYDPNNLLDALKSKFNIERDSSLAALLKIDRVRVSKIRTKLIPISANLLVRMHDLADIPIADLRKLMLPPKAKPKVKPAAATITAPIVESKTRARYTAAFKINAVRMISDTVPCARVAKQLNLPLQTLNNWWVAYRSGNLVSAVWLSAEEAAYLLESLKKRAGELRKSESDLKTRQEKKIITELRKKLNISD
jgi:transposase-like protein